MIYLRTSNTTTIQIIINCFFSLKNKNNLNNEREIFKILEY